MKIDGACHCGAIAYQAEIDPQRVRLCHCTDCQVLTGSAFRFTAPAADEWSDGEPATRTSVEEIDGEQ